MNLTDHDTAMMHLALEQAEAASAAGEQVTVHLELEPEEVDG